MRKLIAILIILSSCTNTSTAVTDIDCPCSVIGIENNKLVYTIKIAQLSNSAYWLTYRTTDSSYRIGQIIK